MKTLTLKTEEMMHQLLAVLDTDIQHLEANINTLDQLRQLVVKQDEDGLKKLLSGLQAGNSRSQENKARRQALRRELAMIYNCKAEEITVSRFAAELSGEMKLQFARRKARLQSLANLMKKEHANTYRLLSDCARFNRMLLKSVFNIGRNETTTYDAAGSTQRQMNTVFMNVQL